MIAEALTATANQGNIPAKDTAKMTEGKPGIEKPGHRAGLMTGFFTVWRRTGLLN
jgi:hypothetical protein